MKNFNYWLKKAQNVFVCNEKSAREYRYFMERAFNVMVGGKEWTV